jgi:hypothetical protein
MCIAVECRILELRSLWKSPEQPSELVAWVLRAAESADGEQSGTCNRGVNARELLIHRCVFLLSSSQFGVSDVAVAHSSEEPVVGF